jgi:hypothetical protein
MPGEAVQADVLLVELDGLMAVRAQPERAPRPALVPGRIGSHGSVGRSHGPVPSVRDLVCRTMDHKSEFVLIRTNSARTILNSYADFHFSIAFT